MALIAETVSTVRRKALLISSSMAVLEVLPDLLPAGWKDHQLTATPEGLPASPTAALLATDVSFDVIILDLGGLQDGGKKVLNQVLTQLPNKPVIALHRYPQPAYARSFIEQGAMGFLPADTNPAELEAAITAINAGHTFISERLR